MFRSVPAWPTLLTMTREEFANGLPRTAAAAGHELPHCDLVRGGLAELAETLRVVLGPPYALTWHLIQVLALGVPVTELLG